MVLRALKSLATPLIRFSMRPLGLLLNLTGLLLAVLVTSWLLTQIGQDFLPPFDEGAAQVNLFALPGTSLQTSWRLSQDRRPAVPQAVKNDGQSRTVRSAALRAAPGRAEQDEHVVGVNTSEYVMTLNHDTHLPRDELIAPAPQCGQGCA